MRLSTPELHALAAKGAAVRLEQLTHEMAALQRFLTRRPAGPKQAPDRPHTGPPPAPSSPPAGPKQDKRRVWTKARRAAHAKRMRAAWRARRNGTG